MDGRANNSLIRKISGIALLAVTILALSAITLSARAQDCSGTNPPTCSYVPVGQTVAVTPSAFTASPVCKSVTNNNCPADILVPTASQDEWSSFINNHESCASITGCTTYGTWVAGSCPTACGYAGGTVPDTCSTGNCQGTPPSTNCQATAACSTDCIPTGQPVPVGQTQCPTTSCFFQVSGLFLMPDLPKYSFTQIGNTETVGDALSENDVLRLGAQNGFHVGQKTITSNIVGPGKYPDSAGTPSNPGPFFWAGYTTFDSVAMGTNTHVTIYSAKNYQGSVYLDVIGPIIINNFDKFVGNGSDPYGYGSAKNHFVSDDWSGYPQLISQFTPNTRFTRSDMHAWSGNSISRTHDADPGNDGGSVIVTCQ